MVPLSMKEPPVRNGEDDFGGLLKIPLSDIDGVMADLGGSNLLAVEATFGIDDRGLA